MIATYILENPIRLDELKEKEFLEVLQQHNRLLHRVCLFYASDAWSRQDLYQEIVIQLWKSFKGFRNESKVSTWMYRVALNTALTENRRSKTKIALQFTSRYKDDKTDENDSVNDSVTSLYAAIAQLTEIEKAIVMFYLEDKGYEEMEEVLGVSQGTLRVKMNRIKEKLRQITKANRNGT